MFLCQVLTTEGGEEKILILERDKLGRVYGLMMGNGKRRR